MKGFIIKSANMSYNREKFNNAVLYIAANAGWDVGKKKLAKLLYFVDFTLYELRKRSLTEMTYMKKDYGPMPSPPIFYPALDNLESLGDIEIEKRNTIGLEKIVPKKVADLSVFDDEEKKVLIQIVKRYSAENAGNLEKIAQSEPPYKMVEYGEQIPYHLAFYRNSFGEMDLGNGKNSDSR